MVIPGDMCGDMWRLSIGLQPRKEISELTHKAMNGNVKFQAGVAFTGTYSTVPVKSTNCCVILQVSWCEQDYIKMLLYFVSAIWVFSSLYPLKSRQDAMAERLQLMADHGMTKEKLEKCVKTEGAAHWITIQMEFQRTTFQFMSMYCFWQSTVAQLCTMQYSYLPTWANRNWIEAMQLSVSQIVDVQRPPKVCQNGRQESESLSKCFTSRAQMPLAGEMICLPVRTLSECLWLILTMH